VEKRVDIMMAGKEMLLSALNILKQYDDALCMFGVPAYVEHSSSSNKTSRLVQQQRV
jgi:hypothetical protein